MTTVQKNAERKLAEALGLTPGASDATMLMLNARLRIDRLQAESWDSEEYANRKHRALRMQAKTIRGLRVKEKQADKLAAAIRQISDMAGSGYTCCGSAMNSIERWAHAALAVYRKATGEQG